MESLHALHGVLPEGEALWTDAVGCLRRIVERSQAMLRLGAIPQRSPDIDRAQQKIQDQLDELAGQLSAAVALDAADEAWEGAASVDVSKMEELLGDHLAAQLLAVFNASKYGDLLPAIRSGIV